MPEDHDLREAARSLIPLVRKHAEIGERDRRLAQPVLEAFVDAGIFRMITPRSRGGNEIDPVTFAEVVEELSRGDGSAGWCAMIGGIGGFLAAALPEDGAAEVFADPKVVTGGALAPLGRAAVAQGGFVVSGRWPFASGCQHCQWLTGGSIVFDGSFGPEGSQAPLFLLPVFPISDLTIHDTWDVSGLRGTGSHDIEATNVFVPRRRAFEMPGKPHEPGPLYRLPIFGALAMGVAAVALGVGRAAIDELVCLAGAKTPLRARKSLAHRPVAQLQAAEAEAALASARALFYQTVSAVWKTLSNKQPLSIRDRVTLRLASTNATLSAARAVDLAYSAGGGTSIYSSSPLQRCFRDVHAITQHFSTAPVSMELVGRVLLGAETDTSFL